MPEKRRNVQRSARGRFNHLVYSQAFYYSNVLGTLTPKHVDLLPADFFSSSSGKRDVIWMYRTESRPGHSIVVSIRVPEKYCELKGQGSGLGLTGRWKGHGRRCVTVCGRGCCC